MSRIKELTEYKNNILNKIFSSQSLLKAVFYRDKNFLDKPDVSIEDVLYKCIYPYHFIPASEKEHGEKKSYITMTITDYKPAGGSRFRAGTILIYAFCHKDLIPVDIVTGDLRTDFMVSEIDTLLSDEQGIGVGRLEFVGMREYVVNSDYLGYALQYRPVSIS